MMLGAMQDWPLTVDRVLDHAARWHGGREIVSREADGSIARSDWADVRDQAARLSHALLELGVRPGDRVATLAWNRTRHLAAWYGIMGIGAVCHTLNPRLFADQIVWIVNHARDRLLIADIDLMGFVRDNLARMPSIERVIVMGGGAGEVIGGVPLADFDTLVAGRPTDVRWGGFDERSACGLCYTSGTTGDPKGVLYSHRSNMLHAMMGLQADALGMAAADVMLPVVPLYHANAWALPFAAPMVGAKLVLPGAQLDAASLMELIEGEGVTFTGGVPTVWQALLHHLDATGARLTTLRRGLIGGAACPADLLLRMARDHGVMLRHAWGMTEMSPFGTMAAPTPAIAALPFEAQLPHLVKQGRVPCGVDMRLVDDEGRPVPHDGTSPGHLLVKGFAVAAGYFRSDTPILDREGWFDTGDIATIDDQGMMQITDRAKDVIKSGGEWISSIEIENIAVGHPEIACAAVVAIPHEKWGERPLLIVEPLPGRAPSPADLLAWLEGRMAKWWLPDEIRIVERVPLGATGKIDKKEIRRALDASSEAG